MGKTEKKKDDMLGLNVSRVRLDDSIINTKSVMRPSSSEVDVKKRRIAEMKKTHLQTSPKPSKEVTQTRLKMTPVRESRDTCKPGTAPVVKSSSSVAIALTEDERNQYGDRTPSGFDKIELLGRGGFALVWLCEDKQTRERFALKQILKTNLSDSVRNEVAFCRYFFDEGVPKSVFGHYPGVENLIKMKKDISTAKDTWLVYELGGRTLTKALFDIKGEFARGERIYNVQQMALYRSIKRSSRHLKMIIRSLASALVLLADNNIVHADLKPDNVLVDYSEAEDRLRAVKLIDFGSAAFVGPEGLSKLATATPEYMPPEVLVRLMDRKRNCAEFFSLLNKMSQRPATQTLDSSFVGLDDAEPLRNTRAIDVWSLGAILLEIITGLPLWMSLKCKVAYETKTVFTSGFLAVKGRTYDKILSKQQQLLSSGVAELLRIEFDAHAWPQHIELLDLVEKMLRWNPNERITPEEILIHPYLL
eukprot:TRINITY_DN1434_c0_g1_i2.p1 TRINITY_DN1434_c0_g1~~TRINITY_DN1434_c0_g1_i2.p1  ORF type:complete len:476 (+),score=125.05 TRINITY_DN1434_c0_g1_i2:370-1797(+)